MKVDDTIASTRKKRTELFLWLVTVAAIGLLVAFYTGQFGISSQPTVQNIQVQTTTQQSVTPPKQVATVSRFRIPGIGVDAAIQQVGLTATNALDVPSNITDVAWYKLGPTPGDVGNAVIDGHLDGPYGVKGVFYNLHDIKVGDLMYVDFKEGFTRTFKVTKLTTYKLGQSTNDIFYNSNGSHLNLITCSGTWDAAADTYTNRLVVFSDLVN